jgi:hypothetical protein
MVAGAACQKHCFRLDSDDEKLATRYAKNYSGEAYRLTPYTAAFA